MLGTTGGRFVGPSGSQTHRNLWQPAAGRTLELQTNGEGLARYGLYSLFPSPSSPASPAHNYQHQRVSTETYSVHSKVTESLFAAGGYNTPPASSPFMPVSPLELVAKNFHSGTVAFSQANSIFVQSQTDFLSGTAVAKKTETRIGRWEHGSVEPLQIQVPPLPPVTNLTIKTENISSSSKIDGADHHHHHHYHQHQQHLNNPHQQHQQHQQHHQHHHFATTTDGCFTSLASFPEAPTTTPTLATVTTTTAAATADLISGCSRTIPISWTASSPSSSSSAAVHSSSFTSRNSLDHHHNLHHHHSGSGHKSCANLLQVKREPCQVSEVTTSNNLGPNASLTAIVKIESPSPKHSTMENTVTSAQSTAGAIPVGIAVARQRLQEHVSAQQPKDLNRFGLSIADLGGATPALSQNMFFTGTNSTMIPLSSEAVTMGVSNVQNAVRTPPALWQYPTPIPMESMMPMPMPPVGFQLVRDPATGQFLFLPTATTIEPFQQAVVWPTYPQTTAIQPPHLLIPPIAQSMQPPPLAPLAPLQLIGSDYLTASTTLHQHTQTHSTRLVALTADTKRKGSNGPATIPLPIPSHTLIKIEDCSGSSTCSTSGSTSHHHHHQQSTIFDAEKAAIQTTAASIATAVQTNEIPSNLTQLYYQHPSSLIQIAPHPAHTSAIMEAVSSDCRPPLIMTPPVTGSTCLTPPPEQNLSEEATSCMPEVQDANIQTDTPIMSEDDNTTGVDECGMSTGTNEDTKSVGGTSSYDMIMYHNMVSTDSAAETELPSFAIINDLGQKSIDSNVVSSTEEELIVERPPRIERPEIKVINQETMLKHSILELNRNVDEEVQKPGNENRSIVTSPVDLSGLELLSNCSIQAFEKKTFIKKEPVERIPSPQNLALTPVAEIATEVAPLQVSNEISDDFVETDEQLGGLNLLCALAEQRFQEEVDQRNKNTSPSSDRESRKRKHKHSNVKKDCKKSRHDKERSKDRKRKPASEDDEGENDDELGKGIKETLSRVRAKYSSCSCNNITDGGDHEKFCRDKINWPTPAELISAMETDMRLRLADITRQCQERQRELDKMDKLSHSQQNKIMSDGESTPPRISTPLSNDSKARMSFFDNQPSPKLIVPLAVMSPNFSSSQSESNLVELPKLSSDTESSKFEDVETSSVERLSKRKGGIPKRHDDRSETETIVAKKPKSLVGYILASKNRVSNSNVKGLMYASNDPTDKKNKKHKLKDELQAQQIANTGNVGFYTTDEDSVSRMSSMQLKIEPIVVKQEIDAVEEENFRPSNLPELSNEQMQLPERKLHHKSKHHSKHKKSRSKERKHRRSSEIRERKRKIDLRCALTDELLDKEKSRVLTSMGGLFYAGCLSPLQPPDIYAVTLDGERGNRPHIMSREEILRDAILEVAPESVAEVPPGTRLCAYWSQQYRCLYPGTAAEPGTPDSFYGGKFVSVEFDDGDSGRIALEDIRYLLSDYPIVEYDPNPLLSLNKRKRRSSQGNLTDGSHQEAAVPVAPSTSTSGFSLQNGNNNNNKDDKEAHRERRRLKKLRKDKIKRISSEVNQDQERRHRRKHKCGDEFCKHRKHKKRRKHKKHHHREAADLSQDADVSQDGNASQNDEETVPEDTISQDDSVSQNGDTTLRANTVKSKANKQSKTNLECEKFDPTIKEETMTEEEVASSVTESSGSYYKPGKKKERTNSVEQNKSKIAAFLPSRQLWAWSGKGYRRTCAKGRVKKQFFKTIQRGKETIQVGDSAVFLSTGRPDRPYIGRIESMWETSSCNMIVRVKWFYHPEETEGCPNLKYPGALFESPHEDENDVQTISHKCEVLPVAAFTKKFGSEPKQYQSIYDNNDTYYLAGYYDPTVLNIKMQPDIPVLPENDKWI